MSMWMVTSLAILVAGLVWFDQCQRRIPNWATLPLLAIFILLHWPGAPEIWLGCILLFLGWKSNWLGGGDAKLWMALLWAVPPEQGNIALLAMAVSFLLFLGKRLFLTDEALGNILWLHEYR